MILKHEPKPQLGQGILSMVKVCLGRPNDANLWSKSCKSFCKLQDCRLTKTNNCTVTHEICDLFKVNNGNSGAMREIGLKLTIKKPIMRSFWCHWLWTLNKFHILLWCFHCWFEQINPGWLLIYEKLKSKHAEAVVQRCSVKKVFL